MLFSFESGQWPSHGEGVLTLNMTIRLPLFGALGVGSGALTLPHVGIWLIEKDYNNCLLAFQLSTLFP